MEPTPDQQLVAFYDLFLKASKQPDLRPATDAVLSNQMQDWEDGSFVEALITTLGLWAKRAPASVS